MKLRYFAATTMLTTLLTGCFPNSPKIQYVDVSSGKPVEVAAPPAPLETSHPTSGVPHKTGSRLITRENGEVGIFGSDNKLRGSALRRICIDGIVYLQDTHVLTPHLVLDTTNHPLLDEDDVGHRVRLKGVTCK